MPHLIPLTLRPRALHPRLAHLAWIQRKRGRTRANEGEPRANVGTSSITASHVIHNSYGCVHPLRSVLFCPDLAPSPRTFSSPTTRQNRKVQVGIFLSGLVKLEIVTRRSPGQCGRRKQDAQHSQRSNIFCNKALGILNDSKQGNKQKHALYAPQLAQANIKTAPTEKMKKTAGRPRQARALHAHPPTSIALRQYLRHILMSPDEDATFAAAMLIAPRLNALPWMEFASTSRACKISDSCTARGVAHEGRSTFDDREHAVAVAFR